MSVGMEYQKAQGLAPIALNRQRKIWGNEIT